MYLRRTVRRTKDGEVAYLQLAHNEWDPVAKQSKVRVIYNFGREDQLDRDAIRRLVLKQAVPGVRGRFSDGDRPGEASTRPWGSFSMAVGVLGAIGMAVAACGRRGWGSCDAI